jgi:hypothetical protein
MSDQQKSYTGQLLEAAPHMIEALHLARNVLFLLNDEVQALGHGAGNVRAKIVAALAMANAIHEDAPEDDEPEICRSCNGTGEAGINRGPGYSCPCGACKGKGVTV